MNCLSAVRFVPSNCLRKRNLNGNSPTLTTPARPLLRDLSLLFAVVPLDSSSMFCSCSQTHAATASCSTWTSDHTHNATLTCKIMKIRWISSNQWFLWPQPMGRDQMCYGISSPTSSVYHILASYICIRRKWLNCFATQCYIVFKSRGKHACMCKVTWSKKPGWDFAPTKIFDLTIFNNWISWK